MGISVKVVDIVQVGCKLRIFHKSTSISLRLSLSISGPHFPGQDQAFPGETLYPIVFTYVIPFNDIRMIESSTRA